MSQIVKNTLGAILIGSGCAAILTGVVATQTLYYFQGYPDDKPLIKLTVAIVWLLDFLHTIMIFTADWVWMIEHFNNLELIGRIPRPLAIMAFFTGLITTVVNLFFAYRIYRLSKGNWFVVGPILTLAVSRLALGLTSSGKMLIHPQFVVFVEKVSLVLTGDFSTSSALDIAITSCLIWYLDHARSGFAGMDQIVNTLCLYAVESGLIIGVAQVTVFCCWLSMHHNYISLGLYLVLAKLYANSLLATLNSRKHIRERTRKTCSSDGAQFMTTFSPSGAPTLKRSTDPLVARQASGEKPHVRHSEVVGVGLSPMKTHAAIGTSSMDTASTSVR